MPLGPRERLQKMADSLERVITNFDSGMTWAEATNAERNRVGDAENMTPAERQAFKDAMITCRTATWWDARSRREPQ